MSHKKKSAYITKEVRFGGKKMILFSLDGFTWSSRKDELSAIQARHEKEKITLNDIKGISEEEGQEQGAQEAGSDPLEAEVPVDYDEQAPAPKKRGRPAGKSKGAPIDKHTAKAIKPAAVAKPHAPKSKKLPLATPKKRQSSVVKPKASKVKSKRKAA